MMSAPHTGMKKKLFIHLFAVLVFLVHGVSNVVEVSVMEGDSVRLHTGVKMSQKDRIMWYFNDIRIAHIIGDLSVICTDVQCNEETESFRDRLKLDYRTGDLTITNVRTTDNGVYKLKSAMKKSFSVSVHGVSAAERDKMREKSVMEGESVNLDPGEPKNPSDVMKWYFNGTLIAEITGDQSQICPDDQRVERFRDRLKLDHRTGSLTITNTRNTDSGEYKLLINSNIHHGHYSIISTIFSVTVTSSGLSAGAVAGIVVVVLLVFVAVAAGVIYYLHRRSKNGFAPFPVTERNKQELLNEDQE